VSEKEQCRALPFGRPVSVLQNKLVESDRHHIMFPLRSFGILHETVATRGILWNSYPDTFARAGTGKKKYIDRLQDRITSHNVARIR